MHKPQHYHNSTETWGQLTRASGSAMCQTQTTNTGRSAICSFSPLICNFYRNTETDDFARSPFLMIQNKMEPKTKHKATINLPLSPYRWNGGKLIVSTCPWNSGVNTRQKMKNDIYRWHQNWNRLANSNTCVRSQALPPKPESKIKRQTKKWTPSNTPSDFKHSALGTPTTCLRWVWVTI